MTPRYRSTDTLGLDNGATMIKCLAFAIAASAVVSFSAPAFAQDKCTGYCAKRCATYSGASAGECKVKCEQACRAQKR